jgi:hypothetical protein
VGPFFIDSSLNQTKYHIILLSNEISNFLDEIPLAVLNRVVFHQDGAISHNALMNFVFLNHLNHFGERSMGAHGAIRWPATSPDLNPLDFFIFIRNFQDNVSSGTQKNLRKKIVRVCQEKPRNFLLNAKVRISRRYRQCLQQH